MSADVQATPDLPTTEIKFHHVAAIAAIALVVCVVVMSATAALARRKEQRP